MFKFYTHTVIRHLWNEWSIKKLKHWKRLHSSPFLHAGRGVQRTTVHKIWQNTRGTLAVRPTDQPDESGSHCTAAVVPLSPPSLLFSSRHPVSRFLLQFGLQHPAVLPSFLPAVLPSFLPFLVLSPTARATNQSKQPEKHRTIVHPVIHNVFGCSWAGWILQCLLPRLFYTFISLEEIHNSILLMITCTIAWPLLLKMSFQCAILEDVSVKFSSNLMRSPCTSLLSPLTLLLLIDESLFAAFLGAHSVTAQEIPREYFPSHLAGFRLQLRHQKEKPKTNLGIRNTHLFDLRRRNCKIIIMTSPRKLEEHE